MAGIRSIGWYVPARQRDAASIASDYRVSEAALQEFGLLSHAVAGPEDHPSSMGAQATKAALDAAGLQVGDLELLIFAGMTRDYPAPWVAAFGVLHELQASSAAGFDLSNRCPAIGDGLWLAACLIQSGCYKTIAVCAADRFDYLLGPPRRVDHISDAAYSAGAAAAIVSRDAANEIAAFSFMSNDDLSLHQQYCPKIGGTRAPLTPQGVEDGLHWWKNAMKLSQTQKLIQFLQAADRHNITAVCKSAGFSTIDFLVGAPLDVKAQVAFLKTLGIGPEKTLITVPRLGHMGGADCLVALGLAIAGGRNIGRRVVMATRSVLYANAVAIRSVGDAMGIVANGTGLDVASWCGGGTPQ
jgi:3-oxoacyl-[acyl-carrier-protein] synthase III